MSLAPPSAASRRVLALVALLLLCTSAGTAIERFRTQPATDFYHYWGIPTARAISADDLGSPYTSRAAYAGVLNDLADRAGDRHLELANKRRRAVESQGSPFFFDPTGTPLFYACFAFLPQDFGAAYALWQGLQFAALLAAVWVLGILLELDRAATAVLGAAATLFFGPFLTDLFVGNVNSIQLLALVLLVAVARALRAFEEPARRARLASLFLAGLTAMTLFKPNLLPLAALLGLHLLCSTGVRTAARALPAAALVAVALIAASAAYFGSLGVWGDWYAFVLGDDPTKLPSYPISKGNFPSAVILARAFAGTRPELWSLALGALLALSLVATARAAADGGTLTRLCHMLADPFLAATLGLLATFACSPLVWFHYYVLALLPLCWLACAPERADARAWLAGLGFAVYSGALDVPLTRLGMGEHVPALLSFGWVPLWIAALIHASRGGGLVAAADRSSGGAAIVDRAVAR